MYRISTVPLTELNQHFICGLCFGYLVDATTIIECPHSFCRSCIVGYLTTENCCPLCGQLVHKTKPLDYICADQILQDLAYKLIPSLYTNEQQRRLDFRESLGENESCRVDNWSEEEQGKSAPTLDTSDADERLSVCLQLADARQPPDYRAKIRSNDRRYLLCPAYASVSVLKKFIHVKFELSTKHRIAMFYAEEDLPDHYTLTDVASLYGWRRLCPLKLFYIVYNPNRLRHFVPDKTSLSSYITYRRLIRKHRHRHLKRVVHDDDNEDRTDETVLAVSSEPIAVSSEHRKLSPAVTEVTAAAQTAAVTSSLALSSVKLSAPANSCTAVVSRSSFSIMRLLSLSEDNNSSSDDTKPSPDADVRTLSTSFSTVGPVTAAESVASQGKSGSKDTESCSEVKPMPVHFKKRMLNTATVSNVVSEEPVVIGQSSDTPRRSAFTIHQDPPVSTAPAKVGIVISHGRAMTLQDKLQMTTSTTSNAARLSPASSSLSAASAACPLRVLNRSISTPVTSHHKTKRHQKPVVKRSLIPSPKTSGSNENDAAQRVGSSGGAAKRPCRKSSKRSELELLLQLDGGTLAASTEFRKANTLRARDNILPSNVRGQQYPPPPVAPSVTYDVLTTTQVSSAPPATVETPVRTCL